LNSVPSMHAGSINPYESTIENAHE
jgi:hypothetical protein